MDNNYGFDVNTDDYALSFSDDYPFSAIQKLQSALSDSESKIESKNVRAYAANVLIGNIPAKKVNECVGDEFILRGFHFKNFKFKDSDRDGKFTTLFGTVNDEPCAYCSSSEKIYEAAVKIIYIYGDVSNWNGGIKVKIKMNGADSVKAYSLEVL